MAAHDSTTRSVIASIAADTRWAFEDPAAQSERARRNIEKRFEELVDPSRTLPPDERAKRAARAKRAYFKTLALKSAQARRKGNLAPDAA